MIKSSDSHEALLCGASAWRNIFGVLGAVMATWLACGVKSDRLLI